MTAAARPKVALSRKPAIRLAVCTGVSDTQKCGRLATLPTTPDPGKAVAVARTTRDVNVVWRRRRGRRGRRGRRRRLRGRRGRRRRRRGRRRRRRGRRGRQGRLEVHHKGLCSRLTVIVVPRGRVVPCQREALSKAGCRPLRPIPAAPVPGSHVQGARGAKDHHQWHARGVRRAAAERGAIGAGEAPANAVWIRPAGAGDG